MPYRTYEVSKRELLGCVVLWATLIIWIAAIGYGIHLILTADVRTVVAYAVGLFILRGFIIATIITMLKTGRNIFEDTF